MFKPLTPKTIAYTTTPRGRLRGFEQRGIYNFLGVPYGSCRRWQTAAPVEPWKGIRNAVQFGTRAFPVGMVFTPWDSCGVAHEAYDYDENCLNLNIWSPDISPDAKKPVMVWIHGGGYEHGSAMEMQCHDGENLARFGDAVVVGINHRLNVFGFMDMSRFGDAYKNSGNCGLSDLVLALNWVQENIGSFGGDKDNVMIFGQSGGGGKVCALLQTPAAEGLFHKAVIMSGVRGVGDQEGTAESDRALEHLLRTFRTDRIEDLEALEPEELLDALKEIPGAGSGPLGWHPIIDDYYPGSVFHAGIRDHAKTIPVMIGTTIGEGPAMRVYHKHENSRERQLEILNDCFPGQDVARAAELFQKAWPERCLTDLIEIQNRSDSRNAAIRYADLRAESGCAPTYVYILAHDFPQEGGRAAWHCADIPIVFHNSALYPENFHDGLLDGLEDAVCASWVNMAKYGDPNNEYLGVQWPPYVHGEYANMIFDTPCSVRYDFDRELSALRAAMTLRPLQEHEKHRQTVN